jgi:hypothetical protein
VYSLIHIILKIFIWSGNYKFYNQFLRQLGLQSFRITLYILPGYQKVSWSKVVMDNCRSICVNHFLNVKICQTVLFFPTLCSNDEGFLCMPYKLCWCVLQNWLCDIKKVLVRSYRRNHHMK